MVGGVSVLKLPCAHRGGGGRCASNTHISRARNCHQLNFASTNLPLHRVSCLWHRKNSKDTQVGVCLPVDDQSQEDWVMPWFLEPKCQKPVTCTSRIQPQMSIGRESVSSNKPACVCVLMAGSGSQYTVCVFLADLPVSSLACWICERKAFRICMTDVLHKSDSISNTKMWQCPANSYI